MGLKKYPPVAAALPRSTAIDALFGGPSRDACLQFLRERLGVQHVVPVGSGRAALYAILKANLTPGAKVILPAYTCYTVAAAVVKAGMTPVLSDNSESDLGYDLAALKATYARHPNSAAIVVPHLFGIPQDIMAIREIVGTDMLLVDDAAQAFDVRLDGKALGTLGDCGIYSFGRGKNIYLGGGGAVVTDSDEQAKRVTEIVEKEFDPPASGFRKFVSACMYGTAVNPYVFRWLAMLPFLNIGGSHYSTGFSLRRMPDYSVRLMQKLLRDDDDVNRARGEVSRKYYDMLSQQDSVVIPRSSVDGTVATLRFPVLLKALQSRAELISEATRQGLGFSAMYPTSLQAVEELKLADDLQCENAAKIAKSIVTLPTHARILRDDGKSGLIERICRLF